MFVMHLKVKSVVACYEDSGELSHAYVCYAHAHAYASSVDTCAWKEKNNKPL